MKTAILALGSNVGDSVAILKSAVAALDSHPQIRVVRVASLYETEPVGGPIQQNFYNSACLIETDLSPQDLLAFCHVVESQAGRVRVEHWGPRTLDIDLIDYEGAHFQSSELNVPHPRAHQRLFVLRPLVDLDPEWRLSEKSVTEWMQSLEDTFEVKLFATEWVAL